MRPERLTRAAGLLLAAAAASMAQAQLSNPQPDWKEAEVAPPAFKTQDLIPIQLRRGTVMRWGVDPASISIGPDSVVRYVVVAQGEAGTQTALYEGLRCSTGEVKVYARHAGTEWQAARDAEWKPLAGNGAALHSLAIAREGACIGHGPNRSAAQVARDLVRPQDTKFRPELR